MRDGRHGLKEHFGHHGHKGRGERKGGGFGHEEKLGMKFQSAQTFRRGRALAFLERLQVMRTTLLQQLNQPEYDAIKQVISGELKAVDAIMQEFIHTFELREIPEGNEDKAEGESADHDDRGTDQNA